MKKYFTKILAIAAMLLSGAWNVNGQTETIIFHETFNNMTTTNTTGNGLVSGNTDETGYVVGGGGSAMKCSIDGTMDLTGGRFATKNLDLTGDVKLYVTYKLGSATTKKFQITIDVSGTSGVGGILNEGGADSPTDFTTKQFTITTGTTASYIHFRTESSHTIILDEIKITKVISSPIISSFTAAGVSATINDEAGTITAELPYGTNLTSITPNIELGGSAISYTPTGAQDFSNSSTTPVTYTASDGTNTKNYAVTLTAKASASTDATLSDLKVDGTTVTGFVSSTLTYDVILPYGSANPVVTAVKNDPVASDPVITNVTSLPGSATVVVTAQAGNSQTYTINFTVAAALKELTELIFSNSFNAFIVGETVRAYYMTGEAKPSLQSYQASAGATVAISADGTKVVVTGADNTTRELALTLESVTPFTGTTPITFDGNETWIKTGYAFYADKGWAFAKAVEEETNKRISEGKSRIYFFVGSYSKLTFTSGTVKRNIKVFVNGTELATPTETAASGSTFDIDLSGASNYMVGIYSNQTSGDGGMTALTTTPQTITSVKQTQELGISFDGKTIRNPNGVSLHVFDVAGRLVHASHTDIEMNNNQKGIYIVKSGADAMKICVK